MSPSQGFDAPLAGADADHLIDRSAPHLAVTDRAGLRCLGDDVDDVTGVGVVDEDFQLYLRDEGDGVLGATVDLGVPALTSVPLNLADRR